MRAASDADVQLLVRKGPALRTFVGKEFDAPGKVAKALNSVARVGFVQAWTARPARVRTGRLSIARLHDMG